MRNESSQNSEGERLLAQQLRDDAAGTRPEFSDALHSKIMQAIGQPQSMPPVALPAPSGRTVGGRSVAFWIGMAASLAILAVGVWRWNVRSNPLPPSPSPVNQTAVAVEPVVQEPEDGGSTNLAVADWTASLESPLVAPHELGSLLASNVAGYSWDDLGQDPRAVGQLVVDQLPFETSAEAWGLSTKEPSRSTPE